MYTTGADGSETEAVDFVKSEFKGQYVLSVKHKDLFWEALAEMIHTIVVMEMTEKGVAVAASDVKKVLNK